MWRRSGTRVLLAASAVALCVTATAHAQRAQSFSLNWVRADGAEDCIGSHELALLIERAVGPVFVAPGDAELAIEGHVWRDHGWHARVAVARRSGEIGGTRELVSSAKSCRALDARIALVIELAIDPEVALEELPPELRTLLDGPVEASAAELLAELRAAPAATARAPEPAPASPAGPAQTGPTAEARPAERDAAQGDADRTRAPERWTFALAPRFALGGGTLPALAAGPGLGLSLQPHAPWSVALAGQLWLAQSATIDAATAVPGEVRLLTAHVTLSGCVAALHPFGGRWDACLGLALAARFARVRGLVAASDANSVDLGPAAGSELALPPLGPLAPLAGVGLRLPLARERITYRDSASGVERTVFTPSALEFWAYLAAALRF